VHGRPDPTKIRAAAGRRRVELALNAVTRYRITDALVRTSEVAKKVYGEATAFEWVGLLSRYGGASVVLSLARENASGLAPFGSVTDLPTGEESPALVEESEEGWHVRVEDCAPRTLLRIHWPLVN
jgi:hypothetical protein